MSDERLTMLDSRGAEAPDGAKRSTPSGAAARQPRSLVCLFCVTTLEANQHVVPFTLPDQNRHWSVMRREAVSVLELGTAVRCARLAGVQAGWGDSSLIDGVGRAVQLFPSCAAKSTRPIGSH